jgi:cell division protein FtsI/penicillin-binding protein 2
VYGQAGLEASLDDYLRGMQGNPASVLWWDRMIYGTPPPGLDVRLSIDLALQTQADDLLGEHSGAIILMNAQTGEIIAMASHPTYNPNNLDAQGDVLTQDPTAPLLNRATQGLYPVGTTMLPLLRAEFNENEPTDGELKTYYQKLGLYKAPALNMPIAFDTENNAAKDLKISPLQASLTAALLTNHGVMPVPRIAIAVDTPQQGWVVLSEANRPVEVIQAEEADEAALSFIVEGKPYWSHVGQAKTEENVITWLLAGTLPDWGGIPLVLVVTIEENNILLVQQIRNNILDAALAQ